MYPHYGKKPTIVFDEHKYVIHHDNRLRKINMFSIKRNIMI